MRRQSWNSIPTPQPTQSTPIQGSREQLHRTDEPLRSRRDKSSPSRRASTRPSRCQAGTFPLGTRYNSSPLFRSGRSLESTPRGRTLRGICTPLRTASTRRRLCYMSPGRMLSGRPACTSSQEDNYRKKTPGIGMSCPPDKLSTGTTPRWDRSSQACKECSRRYCHG